VLVAIDAFTKFAILKPLKTIKGRNVARAVQEIIDTAPFKTKAIYTDRGTEFRNKEMTALLAKLNIRHVYSNAFSPNKTSITERFS